MRYRPYWKSRLQEQVRIGMDAYSGAREAGEGLVNGGAAPEVEQGVRTDGRRLGEGFGALHDARRDARHDVCLRCQKP